MASLACNFTVRASVTCFNERKLLVCTQVVLSFPCIFLSHSDTAYLLFTGAKRGGASEAQAMWGLLSSLMEVYQLSNFSSVPPFTTSSLFLVI